MDAMELPPFPPLNVSLVHVSLNWNRPPGASSCNVEPRFSRYEPPNLMVWFLARWLASPDQVWVSGRILTTKLSSTPKGVSPAGSTRGKTGNWEALFNEPGKPSDLTSNPCELLSTGAVT